MSVMSSQGIRKLQMNLIASKTIFSVNCLFSYAQPSALVQHHEERLSLSVGCYPHLYDTLHPPSVYDSSVFAPPLTVQTAISIFPLDIIRHHFIRTSLLQAYPDFNIENQVKSNQTK